MNSKGRKPPGEKIGGRWKFYRPGLLAYLAGTPIPAWPESPRDLGQLPAQEAPAGLGWAVLGPAERGQLCIQTLRNKLIASPVQMDRVGAQRARHQSGCNVG